MSMHESSTIYALSTGPDPKSDDLTDFGWRSSRVVQVLVPVPKSIDQNMCRVIEASQRRRGIESLPQVPPIRR
jgi:hypothetical protein